MCFMEDNAQLNAYINWYDIHWLQIINEHCVTKVRLGLVHRAILKAVFDLYTLSIQHLGMHSVE